MEDVGILMLIVIVVVTFIVGGMIALAIDVHNMFANEQEVIIEEKCVIVTHLDIDAAEGKYYVSVVSQEGDGFAATFEVTEKEYSSLQDKDVITVEVENIINTHYSNETNYKIIWGNHETGEGVMY